VGIVVLGVGPIDGIARDVGGPDHVAVEPWQHAIDAHHAFWIPTRPDMGSVSGSMSSYGRG